MKDFFIYRKNDGQILRRATIPDLESFYMSLDPAKGEWYFPCGELHGVPDDTHYIDHENQILVEKCNAQ